MEILIDGDNLKIEDVYNVAYNKHKIKLTEECKNKILESRQIVDDLTNQSRVIYGITTGFGSLSKCIIKKEDSEQLSRNLILSHAISVGDYLSLEHVRAAILIRINALAKGFSGIKLSTLEILIEMLNYDIIPLVPKLGSLACSGDLAFLSYIALAISKPLSLLSDSNHDNYDVLVNFNGKIIPATNAFSLVGIEKVKLSSKEGLALTNGSTFTAGLAALCCYRARKFYQLSTGSYVMMMEALGGTDIALNDKIHQARGQKGQISFANDARKMLSNSQFINTSGRLQDAYTLRCGPQVHGTLLDTLEHCENIISIEINAATDNPLVFGENEVYSGGNFHGEPIAQVMDYLKINLCKVIAMSERRQFRILDSSMNGWNNGIEMLTPNPGLESGYMITHYTSASLFLRCQKLAFPNSVLTVPTCANQEDHNSNGWNGVLDCWEMLDLCENIITFEYLLATRAIWLLKQTDKYKDLKLGDWTNNKYEILQNFLIKTTHDHIIGEEHKNIMITILDNDFLK